MRETQAIIERVRRVNEGFQQLDLSVDESLNALKPGQSLLARLTDRWDPYLREHWWPVNGGKNTLVVERPGSQLYEPGQIVSLLGIIGQPYRFRRNLRQVLLIAYDIAPTALLMPIPALLSNKVSVTMVLLGKASEYETKHLPPEVEVIHGDSELNWPNRVTTVGWADQIFMTVAQDDELARFNRLWDLLRDLRADIPKSYVFGVFQTIQPCGIGACQACMVRLTEGQGLVCVDGPAFDLTTVNFR